MNTTNFSLQSTPEYIFFLQHPEQYDHYLIVQDTQVGFNDLYAQFRRTGKYENKPAIMPYNNVTLTEKIPVPDKSLFGLSYFICNESGDVSYEEDSRWPYAEMGWYVIKGQLQTSKWLNDYLKTIEEKNKLQVTSTENTQMTLF